MKILYCSMKDKDTLSDDIKYYPRVLIEQCRYRDFSNNRLIYPSFVFTDFEPDDNDESEEEEINENTV